MQTELGMGAGEGIDPRYRQGMTYLQAGDWKKAGRCFEELLGERPGDAAAQRGLEEARFKARLDAAAHVRAKRWAIPWDVIVVRVLLVAAIAVLGWQAWRMYWAYIAPQVARYRAEVAWRQQQAGCEKRMEKTPLDREDLDAAEACFQAMLAARPGNEAAQEGLQRVAAERELLALYEQALALEQAGDDAGALELYQRIAVSRTSYRDVTLRIEAIRQRQDREALFARAEADYAAGRLDEAISGFERLRQEFGSFQSAVVESRLFELYMRRGTGLLEQDPPTTEAVLHALEDFNGAVSLRPRDTQAAQEQRLARLFLNGETHYNAGHWEAAAQSLRAVYDARPGYLRGLVTAKLYQAYVQSGDQFWAAGDCNAAYGQYQTACGLPVSDRAVCRAGMSRAQPCLTPTPTPTPTFTPTPVPTATPWPTWTPIPPTGTPTPTPTPVPLSTLRGKIVFIADDPDQPGVWVMDPDGKNRRYLGPTKVYEKQIKALRDREAYSPDGKYRAYTTYAYPSPQVWIVREGIDPQFGQIPPRQLTRQTGLSYDPVWSPLGDRIAFVSQENGSDDIWVINVDGTDVRWLVRNTWEWDKHPTWSPDGRRIAFWSNRNLLKQIYVMESDGRDVTNISNTQWDEYDPIWIK